MRNLHTQRLDSCKKEYKGIGGKELERCGLWDRDLRRAWDREPGANWGQQTADRELGTGNWGLGTGGRELGQGTGRQGTAASKNWDRELGTGNWDFLFFARVEALCVQRMHKSP